MGLLLGANTWVCILCDHMHHVRCRAASVLPPETQGILSSQRAYAPADARLISSAADEPIESQSNINFQVAFV